MKWAAVAAAIGLVVVAAVIENVRERRRQRRIAESRETWTEERFLATLGGRGVADDTAWFVWTQIQPYYFAPLTPQPDDDLIATMKVDPEDFGDDASDYAAKFGFDWPGDVWLAWPDPLTPASFALWLDALRANAANHRPR